MQPRIPPPRLAQAHRYEVDGTELLDLLLDIRQVRRTNVDGGLDFLDSGQTLYAFRRFVLNHRQQDVLRQIVGRREQR